MNHKLTRLCISIFSLLLICNSLYSEDYTIKQTYKGSVFYQKLEWESSGVVKEYKVIVQQKKSGEYKTVKELTTKNTYCEVSLDAGDYRYKVQFYNVLGQMAFQTSWRTFEVKVAFKPEIKLLSPSFIDLSKVSFNGTFLVKLTNVDDKSRIYIVPLSSKNQTEIAVKKTSTEKDGVRLSFPAEKIKPGKYKIYVKNAGGLTASTGTIRIVEKQDVFWEIGGGWNPEFIVYDDNFKSYLGTSTLLQNIYAQGSVFYDLPANGMIGFQMALKDSIINHKTTYFTHSGNLLSMTFDGVYTLPVADFSFVSLNLDVFAGFGFSWLGNMSYKYADEIKTTPVNSAIPVINGGACVKGIFNEKYYAQLGMEFLDGLKISDSDYSSGSINLFVGGGMRF